jgi:hypothetical protein
MANTLATQVAREKYRKATLEVALRNALVAEKICEVDRSDAKVIKSPYSTTPTTVVQALAGTYAVADFTTTNDTLTVTDEFIVGEHIFDFESTLSDFDLFANRIEDHTYSVAAAIDKYVLNNLLELGTGTYTTPSGGFTTAANINVIMANLLSQVAGYADTYKGMYLVIENTDVVGFAQAQATNGFSFADAALNNGFMTNYMGVDIYVVRTATFADGTAGAAGVGTLTYTNSGHRLFGVKNVSTYAAPRGINFEEKAVSGKTGKEIVTYGYVGIAVWVPKRALTIDITLTA